jgi:hypothetical protein
MNEERAGKCFRQMKHIRGHLSHDIAFFPLLIELPLQRLVESKQILPHYLPIILERLGDIDSNFYLK